MNILEKPVSVAFAYGEIIEQSKEEIKFSVKILKSDKIIYMGSKFVYCEKSDYKNNKKDLEKDLEKIPLENINTLDEFKLKLFKNKKIHSLIFMNTFENNNELKIFTVDKLIFEELELKEKIKEMQDIIQQRKKYKENKEREKINVEKQLKEICNNIENDQKYLKELNDKYFEIKKYLGGKYENRK